MPILIQSPEGPISAEQEAFVSENELETVIASKPDLLISPGDQPLAFVAFGDRLLAQVAFVPHG